jgi:hypothetical protein
MLILGVRSAGLSGDAVFSARRKAISVSVLTAKPTFNEERTSMATKAQIEKAILAREGFRVELELFEGKRPSLPPYDYPAMAPQRWKVSDWKNARLDAYRLLVRGITIYRGDAKPIPRDMQLGNLRDTYFEETCGSLEPPHDTDDSKVIQLRGRVKRQPKS